MVAAAARMARRLALSQPDRVILVGTAGAYPGGPDVGDVVTASLIGLGSVASARGLGYVPRAPSPMPVTPLAGLRVCTVLSLTAITTDPELADEFARDWQIEHMEAFGVATACAAAGVPLTVVLGITNTVGPGAHAEWLANRSDVEEAARTAIREAIRGGAG